MSTCPRYCLKFFYFPSIVYLRLELEFALAMENSNSSDENKHEGWLTKKGKIRKNWQRRWCVLEGGELKYYKQKPSNKVSIEILIDFNIGEESKTSRSNSNFWKLLWPNEF